MSDQKNNIPTAEEFLKFPKHTLVAQLTGEVCSKKMIEFAQLHVKAALKAAAENAEINMYSQSAVGQCDISTASIIEAYPLDLIV